MDWAELEQRNARRSSGRRPSQQGCMKRQLGWCLKLAPAGPLGLSFPPSRLPTMSYRDYGRDRSRSPARDYGRSSGGYGGGSR